MWISKVHLINCCCNFWPSFLTFSSVGSHDSLSLSLSVCLCLSLSRLIAPKRCVMSALAFFLALLMWQFEGCDYLVSQVTDGRWGGLDSDCLTYVINETQTWQNMLVCVVMQCLQFLVCTFINQYIDTLTHLFAVFLKA